MARNSMTYISQIRRPPVIWQNCLNNMLRRIQQSNTIKHIFYIILVLFLTSCDSALFETVQNENGVLITEKGQKVLFYQVAPKDINGAYARANYIHPLYDLDGDTLTQDFPEDDPIVHYHQRGIYWAWHQVYVNGKRMGNPWTCKDFNWDVYSVLVEQKQKNKITLKSKVNWTSSQWKTVEGQLKPFATEACRITVHARQKEYRAIDFEIEILALEDSVMVGGSEDVKGYGGFSARIKMPDDLSFISMNQPIEPRSVAVSAGPWMDFSGTFKDDGIKNGITILCDSTLATYTGLWILRSAKSMQNPVFPGRWPVHFKKNKPTKFRYRLIIHHGDHTAIDLNKLYNEFQNQAGV